MVHDTSIYPNDKASAAAQHSNTITIDLTKADPTYNVRPTDFVAVPPSAALKTHKRLISEVRSTMDVVLLPEVCTKCPTFSDMSSMLSQPDRAKTIGFALVTRMPSTGSLLVEVARCYVNMSCRPNAILQSRYRRDIASRCISLIFLSYIKDEGSKRCSRQAMEAELSINRQSTVKRRVSDAPWQLPAWVAPSL